MRTLSAFSLHLSEVEYVALVLHLSECFYEASSPQCTLNVQTEAEMFAYVPLEQVDRIQYCL